MISLAITTYNRSGFTIESFINVLDNDYIDEIIIVDDCSDMTIVKNLRKIIDKINNGKIHPFRQRRNTGVLMNKIKTVEKCKNEWVIMLDSDNVIDNDYIDIIKTLPCDKNTLYCPARLLDINTGKVQWDYSAFADIVVDRVNIVEFVEDTVFETHLNTGNNFIHRNTFLAAMALREESPNDVLAADSTYISYLWLLAGNKMKIVPNLGYRHRTHSGSFYLQHVAEGIASNNKIYQKMRELNPPAGGFIVSKEFKTMIGRSYDFDQARYDSDPKWDILEEMYVKNFINAEDHWNQRIPKRIHQIWLGGIIPDKYKVYTDTWQRLHPDWEYKLWTDADTATMDLPNRNLFDSMTNYGPKSDLLRYHLLNEYGGLYADTDFECLRSFNDFLYLEFFTGISYQMKVELYPGLIGCIPHHPVIEKTIEGVKNIRSMPNDGMGVLETISSYFFTRMFWEVIKGYTENTVAFPPDYFYPFPNQKGHAKRDGCVYIKDCSYALHHWAVSWLKR